MAKDYVTEIFELVGAASRCWTEKGGHGVFDEQSAVKIADRLCDIVREARGESLESEPPGNPGMTVIQ